MSLLSAKRPLSVHVVAVRQWISQRLSDENSHAPPRLRRPLPLARAGSHSNLAPERIDELLI